MTPADERAPRVGMKLALRGLLACVLVLALTATAVATAVIREVQDFVRVFEGSATIESRDLDRAKPGGARTFMILGSDERKGPEGGSARSDTILLVRADPRRDAIGVMSIPRDLQVEIPDHGLSKINAAFDYGGRKHGPGLVVRTVKHLFRSRIGERLPITNVMVIDYGAFRRAVDYIGGVYVDIDRDYFNDNSSGQNYATIDVDPGYQKLKGRDALDYVRYRHTDSDLIRAARQQDFLRQAKNAKGVRRLLRFSDRKHLARVFSRYFEVDKSLAETKQVFSMLRLVLYLAQEDLKVEEVPFNVQYAANAQVDTNLYMRDSDLRRAYRRFMGVGDEPEPPQPPARPRRPREADRTTVRNLEDARAEGRDQAALADPRPRFPFYFPALRLKGSVYEGTAPRVYTIKDERGRKRRAYRLVLQAPGIGEYYGVQGLTWKRPPILEDPDRIVRHGGRRLEVFYDGRRVRLVAWRTKRAVYWVTNTLTQKLGSDQMLEIASSLQRRGR